MKAIDPSVFQTHFTYDPDTGLVRRKFWTNGCPKYGWDKPVGDRSDNKQKYYGLKFQSSVYKLHRVIWAMQTGEDPGDMQIDHINGNTFDNRWANLRLATPLQNSQNRRVRNKYGVPGIYKQGQRYIARIGVDKRAVVIGVFDSLEEAVEARKNFTPTAFGEFTRSPDQIFDFGPEETKSAENHGVYKKAPGQWMALIKSGKRYYSLGVFPTQEECRAAKRAALVDKYGKPINPETS